MWSERSSRKQYTIKYLEVTYLAACWCVIVMTDHVVLPRPPVENRSFGPPFQVSLECGVYFNRLSHMLVCIRLHPSGGCLVTRPVQGMVARVHEKEGPFMFDLAFASHSTVLRGLSASVGAYDATITKSFAFELLNFFQYACCTSTNHDKPGVCVSLLYQVAHVCPISDPEPRSKYYSHPDV